MYGENKLKDNDLLIKSLNWKFNQQNIKDRNLWNNLIIVHNYFYKCNMELKRSFLMELFYPNQKIWDATTIDVYRRYIERAGYSSKVKTGVYRMIFYLPNISLQDIKKEGKKLSNQKPF